MSYDYLAAAAAVAAVARTHAASVDAESRFPTAAIELARERGLFGLLSSPEVGGHGLGLDAASQTIERLARECGSTAMVLTMHYSGTVVIEKHGPLDVRRAIARGEHLSTLAFSENGSRSHFWVPVGTARVEGDSAVLDSAKSWVTSASHANAYVWSSKPSGADGASTLWLVDRTTAGLAITGRFDGIGLRGNDSAPVKATSARVPLARRLGGDGDGFGIMMQTVLPTFAVLIASGSVGMMEAAVEKTAEHAAGMKYEHLGQSPLCELPTIRAYVAKMRIQCDQARALLENTLAALEHGRPDAPLRVLEVKAATAEAAREVLDTAMRVCAGQAFRKEVGVERRFRDSRAALIMAPTSDQLYDFIGKAVCGLPLF
ncbi:MAG: acyl-CoA/acyl-ACP dehydrogenase [Planctomycetes bacterium]|nr:acyl-CoA/acyl-ACP dehydrogenase [Planctomycetota bacterium]